MRTKRLLPLAAILGLILGLSLTACQKKESAPAANSQPPASQTTPEPVPGLVQNEPPANSGSPEQVTNIPPAPEERKPAARPKPKPPRTPAEVTVVAGSVIHAALQAELTSHEARAGDTFALEVTDPIEVDGYTAIPSGARVTGKVMAAKGSGSIKGRGEITLAFVSVTDANGDNHPIEAETFYAKAEGAADRDAAMIAGGAAGGAIIGGLLGGKKGATIGGLVGAAAGTGTVLATKGPEVKLGIGQVFKIHLTQSLAIPPAPRQ